jgi:hypothetical protein
MGYTPVMRLLVIGCVAFLASPSSVLAQPSSGQASGPPPPHAAASPPYGQPGPPLTAEEQDLLMQGEISAGEHIGGGVLAWFIGFGSGHAVQGRYSEKGWIFTVGEGAGLALAVVGAVQCRRGVEDLQVDDGPRTCDLLFGAGAVVFVGFRLWEVIDAMTGPASHNRKVRRLRNRHQQPAWHGFVVPAGAGDGAVAGMTLRF